VKPFLKRSFMVAVVALFSLVGCGYHLVGHGDNSGGAIPADVTALSLVGNADTTLMLALQQRLQADRYAIVAQDSVIEDLSHYAMLHVNLSPLVFTPSAFDAAGIATQYRMIFAGTLVLDQQGKNIWQSGVISRQADVFVTGSPTSIEAGRERVLKDLQKQWLSDAVGRVRSGF